MAKFICKKVGTIEETKEMILLQINTIGVSTELVDCYSFESHWFGVFEKYYYRAKSYTALSLHIFQKDSEVYVEAISAGGGSGMFNISFGSEENMLIKFEALMKKHDFHILQVG